MIGPSRFCPLLGECTLLEQTRQRAERSILPGQILYSVTQAHLDYYVRDLAGRASQAVAQPCNRGTAPAILSSLLRIFEIDSVARVAILPCDHPYSPEAAFTAALESAFSVAEERPASVVLLGAEPDTPEPQYGWIELRERVVESHSGVFHVDRFWEKSPPAVAARLFRTGSLWNTFVMLGRVTAFLELALEFVPELMALLRTFPFRTAPGREIRIQDRLYDRIAPRDFSRQVLSPGVVRLISLRLSGAKWNDLGDPERVIRILEERDLGLPACARRWRDGEHAEGGPAPPAAA
jgi:mannose-1-phosphate guanylyltransferase